MLEYWPSIVTAIGGVILVLLALRPSRGGTQGAPEPKYPLYLFACGLFSISLVTGFVDRSLWWGWVLASLPSGVLLDHAIFIGWLRRQLAPQTGPAPATAPATTTTTAPATETTTAPTPAINAIAATPASSATPANVTAPRVIPVRLQAAHKSIVQRGEEYFSPMSLGVRYGTPAVQLGILALVIFHVLAIPQKYAGPIANEKDLLFAARLGAVGAYTYVLLYLAQRRFRRDISSAAASWCAVTLALGPIVAAVLQVVWMGPEAPTVGAPPPGGAPAPVGAAANGAWVAGSVYFLAGFSPRFAIDSLREGARRLMTAPMASAVSVARLVPLNQIRGVGADTEERLAEEGIVDVTSLALADPLKLMRNTSYDMRQIVAWIDEAILLTTLPLHWQALENEGITGAIDLAWYQAEEVSETPPGDAQRKENQEARGPAAPQTPGAPPQGRQAALLELAKRASIDPRLLESVSRRLVEDEQVQLVWAMYQMEA